MQEKHESQCAPGVKKQGGSCMPSSSRARSTCKTDRCLAKGSKALESRLRPEMPKTWVQKPTTLLNTLNIDDVMFQYERAFPFFKYLKTLPIDAFNRNAGMCVSEFCELNPKELYKSGKKLIGMVLNLDKHNQPGSHWVMSAVDMRVPNKPVILYYDSFGRPPPAALTPFYEKMLALTPETNAARKHMHKYSCYNSKAHQRKNTECGVYSILALEAVIYGVPFQQYCSQDISDEEVQKQRYRLYDQSE